MKIKYICLMIILLLSTSCFKKEVNLFFGEEILVQDNNFINLLNKSSNEIYDDSFSSSNFYMKSFYNLIENEAIDLKSKTSITKLIKNANKVIINVGNYEFLRFVNYNSYLFEFNEKVVSVNKEMFEYYFISVLDYLKLYVDEIIIIPPYQYLFLEEKLNDKYITLLNEYTSICEEVSLNYSIELVDINKISRFVIKNKVITPRGGQYLIEEIVHEHNKTN